MVKQKSGTDPSVRLVSMNNLRRGGWGAEVAMVSVKLGVDWLSSASGGGAPSGRVVLKIPATARAHHTMLVVRETCHLRQLS